MILPALPPTVPFLSAKDVERLELFKVKYQLEAHGFSAKQAERLLFARYLREHGAISQ